MTLPRSYILSKWQVGDRNPPFLPSQTLDEPYYVTRTVTGSEEKKVGLGRTLLEGSPERKWGVPAVRDTCRDRHTDAAVSAQPRNRTRRGHDDFAS